MQDFTQFFQECDRAPRINELSDFFASTAAGRSGSPIKQPQIDRRLLIGDEILDRFVELHMQRRGPFDQHYHSSIPYRLEEECRLGHAILRYSSDQPDPLNLYTLGTAEGTMARVIAELADGSVRTLSCSPNLENYRSFLGYGDPPNASFFVGPFHHLSRELIRSRPDLQQFVSGFDIILEDTTFQMYSPNRPDQIAFVAQHLKDDGLFVFLEKFLHPDLDEYRRREDQKDHGFKARFFRPDEIAAKRNTVLSIMNQNEVTLHDMGNAIKQTFRHCHVTWNSGNFYSLVASNSTANIERFLSHLIGPAIPHEYVYETLPRATIED